jgi:hypothetical protein
MGRAANRDEGQGAKDERRGTREEPAAEAAKKTAAEGLRDDHEKGLEPGIDDVALEERVGL